MSVNTPVTIWQAPDGFSEFSFTGLVNITDTTGTNLTDTTGTVVTDTGVVNTRVPATVWSQDDSI